MRCIQKEENQKNLIFKPMKHLKLYDSYYSDLQKDKINLVIDIKELIDFEGDYNSLLIDPVIDFHFRDSIYEISELKIFATDVISIKIKRNYVDENYENLEYYDWGMLDKITKELQKRFPEFWEAKKFNM